MTLLPIALYVGIAASVPDDVVTYKYKDPALGVHKMLIIDFDTKGCGINTTYPDGSWTLAACPFEVL